MKRFQVHIAVDNLDTNIVFYSKIFGQWPTKQEADSAKWVLNDPPLNFLISSEKCASTLPSFGIQGDSQETSGKDTACSTTCCKDPQGFIWENCGEVNQACCQPLTNSCC